MQQTPAHLLVARLIRRCTCLQRHAWDRPVRMWPGCNCFFLFPPVDVYFLEISFCLMFVGSNAMQIYAISHIYITYNYIIHIYIYIYVHDITLGMIYAYIHSYIRYVRTYVHYFIGDYHYLWAGNPVLKRPVSHGMPGGLSAGQMCFHPSGGCLGCSTTWPCWRCGKLQKCLSKWHNFTVSTPHKSLGNIVEQLSFKSTNCTRLRIQFSAAALVFPLSCRLNITFLRFSFSDHLPQGWI